MNTVRKPIFKHFHDLTATDINAELHMHTNRTDGEAPIEMIVAAAVQARLKRIAFTEHVRRDTNWFADFASEVRNVARDYPQINIFVGCEAKALDPQGELDASATILADCDLVLGSVHRFPDGNGRYIDFSTLTQQQTAEIEFELACGLLKAAPIDVLAHPGGMYFRQYKTDFPVHFMRELMERSLKQKVALEINSAYIKNFDAFLQLCAEVNPVISIGSDMHRLNKLGDCREQLLSHGVGSS